MKNKTLQTVEIEITATLQGGHHGIRKAVNSATPQSPMSPSSKVLMTSSSCSQFTSNLTYMYVIYVHNSLKPWLKSLDVTFFVCIHLVLLFTHVLKVWQLQGYKNSTFQSTVFTCSPINNSSMLGCQLYIYCQVKYHSRNTQVVNSCD